VLAWLFVWSEVQTCIWPSWCHCHSVSLASVQSGLVLPFSYRLTWVVTEKGPLNRCVCVFNYSTCKRTWESTEDGLWEWQPLAQQRLQVGPGVGDNRRRPKSQRTNDLCRHLLITAHSRAHHHTASLQSPTPAATVCPCSLRGKQITLSAPVSRH